MKTTDKLQEFMAWCNTELLKEETNLMATYSGNKVLIYSRLNYFNYLSGITISKISKKCSELELIWLVECINGKPAVEIQGRLW